MLPVDLVTHLHSNLGRSFLKAKRVVLPSAALLQGLDHRDYCGFNLLVGDLQQQQVAYISNRGTREPQLLAPGSYGA